MSLYSDLEEALNSGQNPETVTVPDSVMYESYNVESFGGSHIVTFMLFYRGDDERVCLAFDQSKPDETWTLNRIVL